MHIFMLITIQQCPKSAIQQKRSTIKSLLQYQWNLFRFSSLQQLSISNYFPKNDEFFRIWEKFIVCALKLKNSAFQ